MKNVRFALVAAAPALALLALAACKDNAVPEPTTVEPPSAQTVTIPSSAPKPSSTLALSTSAAPSASSASSTVVASSASAASSAKAATSTSATSPVANGPSTQKTAAQLAPALAKDTAPAEYKAKFNTTKGSFTVDVHRDWAPVGADRFYNLVKLGFYNETRFFRVVDGFMVQWGIHGDPAVNAAWKTNTIQDDPVKQSNKKGFISFATSGANSRTTQVFINFGDNGRLDGMGFASFGQIVDGQAVVDSLYKGYGEGAPRGMGPDQGRMQSEGNTYLKKDFDKLDWIKEAHIDK
jgi:peptidyl-prolyl cis-trans isomerase A (cyclophilin A)